jgi:hypothetical protein
MFFFGFVCLHLIILRYLWNFIHTWVESYKEHRQKKDSQTENQIKTQKRDRWTQVKTRVLRSTQGKRKKNNRRKERKTEWQCDRGEIPWDTLWLKSRHSQSKPLHTKSHLKTFFIFMHLKWKHFSIGKYNTQCLKYLMI